MKFDRRLTDEIYTSDTVRLGKNAFQAMRETIYHNGGVSFRGASGEMILYRLDLKKIFISTGSACDSKTEERYFTMIYKKQYGQPFDTESVVGSFLPMMETIPYLTKEPDGFSYAMEPQDVLYGLGENVRGINKRGWVYESKCSDDGNHTEGKSSLYGAYNFMIVSGKDTFGVLSTTRARSPLTAATPTWIPYASRWPRKITISTSLRAKA